MIKCIETDKTYQKLKEASQELNITTQAISMCLNGKRKKAGGYTFIRVTEKVTECNTQRS